MSRKLRDRRDGTRIKIGGFEKFMCSLKPRRSDSEVYISRLIDVSKLVKYMKEKKKVNNDMTYFHLFAMAIAKIVYNKPLLNRFIINGKYYDRNEVTLSFVAKTSFTDEAKELLTVVTVDKDDNVDKLSKKILGDVKKIRSNQSSNADDFVDKLGCLPMFLMRIIVWFVKVLDNFDLLPKSLTKNSIYHSTVLLSNLGSIHCGAIYHNLTNFGTNSIVVTIGEIKQVEDTDKYICEFGITLDERIADGVYFAKSVNLFEYILNNPELLEDDANVQINIE